MSDVILNKIQTIERCIRRINEEYIDFEDEFKYNFTKQDSVILNLERDSQATIDIAIHDYQNLNIKIVIAIVEGHLVNFEDFINEIFNNYLKKIK